jgi:hypothetical protein
MQQVQQLPGNSTDEVEFRTALTIAISQLSANSLPTNGNRLYELILCVIAQSFFFDSQIAHTKECFLKLVSPSQGDSFTLAFHDANSAVIFCAR